MNSCSPEGLPGSTSVGLEAVGKVDDPFLHDVNPGQFFLVTVGGQSGCRCVSVRRNILLRLIVISQILHGKFQAVGQGWTAGHRQRSGRLYGHRLWLVC